MQGGGGGAVGDMARSLACRVVVLLCCCCCCGMLFAGRAGMVHAWPPPHGVDAYDEFYRRYNRPELRNLIQDAREIFQLGGWYATAPLTEHKRQQDFEAAQAEARATGRGGLGETVDDGGERYYYHNAAGDSTSLYPPIPVLTLRVDLVFVGFNGQGKEQVTVTPDQLRRWFEGVQGEQPPAFLQHAEYLSDDDTVLSDAGPRVRYQFHAIDVSDKVAGAVAAFLEHHILPEDGAPFDDNNAAQNGDDSAARAAMDNEGRQSSRGEKTFYVPSWQMETFLSELSDVVHSAESTGFEYGPLSGVETQGGDGVPAAMTVFVLNHDPAFLSNVRRERYGYRMGFSDGALQDMVKATDLVKLARSVEQDEQQEWRSHAHADGTSSEMLRGKTGLEDLAETGEVLEREDMANTHMDLIWHDAIQVTEEWADRVLQRYSSSSSSSSSGSSPGDGAADSEQQQEEENHDSRKPATKKKQNDPAVLAYDMLMDDSPEGLPLRQALVHDLLLHEIWQTTEPTRERSALNADAPTSASCLSETWVGQKRLAWVDLAAGPFSLGPIIGGEGVKGHLRIARPPGLPPSKSGPFRNEDVDGTFDMDPPLRAAFMRRVLSRRLTHLRGLYLQLDCPEIDEDALLQFDKSKGLPRGPSLNEEVEKELRVPACRDLAVQIAVLHGIVTRSQRISDQRHDLLGSRDANAHKIAVAALVEHEAVVLETVRDDIMPLSTNDVSVAHRPEERKYLERLNGFVASLASLVSTLVRQTLLPPISMPAPVAPPTARWQRLHHASLSRLSQLSTTASARDRQHDMPMFPSALSVRFVARVSVTFYVVRCQHTYDPLNTMDGGGFDLVSFKRELFALHNQYQDVSFTVHGMHISEDPEMQHAFHQSIRVRRMPLVHPDGSVTHNDVSYLDSTRFWRTMVDDNAAPGGGRGGGGMAQHGGGGVEIDSTFRRLTVFLFSMDLHTPLFVDQQHFARPVGDMLLIVQNAQQSVPSPVVCNEHRVMENGRNPLRHALGAMGILAGGLVPSTWSYDAEEDRVYTDWAWSTGQSPVRCGASHPSFGQLDRDNIGRAVCYQALVAATQLVDVARQNLHDVGTLHDYPDLEKPSAALHRMVTRLHSRVQKRSRRIVDLLETHHYERAAAHINPLMWDARRALETSEDLHAILTPLQCVDDGVRDLTDVENSMDYFSDADDDRVIRASLPEDEARTPVAVPVAAVWVWRALAVGAFFVAVLRARRWAGVMRKPKVN